MLCSYVNTKRMRVSAKAPCRVDLAGATLDIWPLYLFHDNVVTVNFAVNRYTYCDIETRTDSRIVLRSRDLGKEETFESFDELYKTKRYRLPLPAQLIRFFAPTQGLTLESNSEAPAGAGISGSSALMISVASALNKVTGRNYTLEKIREIAQNVEAQVIRVPTGSQDYYPAMYGGVSAVELGPGGIVRTSLSVDAAGLDQLDQRFVLAYTGAPRNSGINNWEVMKGHIDGDKSIQRNFDRIARIAVAMRQAVEQNDWDEAGRLMRAEWAERRKNVPGITTPLIDKLVAAAMHAGSIGAKACGAGGGGCVVFLVKSGAKEKVSSAIAATGADVLDAKVARRGLRVN
jgi:D-glycero-alpha-D-manno-heptose-7-phosphate kinase